MFNLGKFLRKYICFYCINAEKRETEIIYNKIRNLDQEDSNEFSTEI